MLPHRKASAAALVASTASRTDSGTPTDEDMRVTADLLRGIDSSTNP